MVTKSNGSVGIPNKIIAINDEKENGPVGIPNKVIAINGEQRKWSYKHSQIR